MTAFRRNLFEIENARNLTRDELVATYVPTRAFWRLLSAKNHIVLGSRGSGKTALAKMLSHDHLSRLKDEKAAQVIKSKSFVGIYVPTRLEWVGGLKNKPWQSEHDKEYFFQWRLNISTCLSFLRTVRSCLDTYIPNRGQRARLESQLAHEFAKSWSDGTFECDTMNDVHIFLEDVEHQKQQQLARLRAAGQLRPGEAPAGIEFETELFSPLRRGIALTSRILDFPQDTTWLMCLDEAEFLEESHHRILNSHLRSHSGNLAFKITTMPYYHHTLDTNAGVPLDYGHDFEYVYIDQDPILLAAQATNDDKVFAGLLFNKRAEISFSRFRNITLKRVSGESMLLNTADDEDWSLSSPNFARLRRFASQQTVVRAERLMSEPAKFRDQIVRKLRGALLLREAVADQKGREELDAYAGAQMIIRCGDANPRRLIRIFNSLLSETRWMKVGHTLLAQRVPAKSQTRILTQFSTSTLSRVQSEPQIGPKLVDLLYALGEYMRHCLHDEPLATDQISSITASIETSPAEWFIIRRAVGLGLLFPNIGAHNPDQMPERDGTFHLAYVLAPHFRILPRRGKSRQINSVLSYWRAQRRDILSESTGQPLLFPPKSGDEE